MKENETTDETIALSEPGVQMSLSFFAIAVSTFFIACNNSPENQETIRDIPIDTVRNAEIQELDETTEISEETMNAENILEDPESAELAPWYPDFQEGVCKDDGNGPDDVVPTTTYQLCCKRFIPLTEQACNAKSGPIQAPWYPSFVNGRCKADGDGPDNVLHTSGHEECCFRFFPSSEQECIAASPGA